MSTSINRSLRRALSLCVVGLLASSAWADPCGMVPPVYTGPGNPITRIGEQQTYVFYQDGVESFVIRPGFQGKVEDFGMLIPFPTPPAVRKMPDHTFPHVAAAVDPPEVVIDVRPIRRMKMMAKGASAPAARSEREGGLELRRNEVRVLREEAVGMYEVAVLEAGSPEALQKWMTKNGYKYPDGMDKVCNEYIEDRWCFVAVKTKVADKKAVDPHPGQRRATAALPTGATFDGHVQAMGFRFKTDKLVVPMRLSAFNDGELRNIVYLLTDGPRKIRSIPEEYVVRQVTGSQLIKNVTEPLPLRIIGGTEKDLKEWHLRGLKERRDPTPKNGAAKQLFAADLRAVSIGELALPHEEQEKQLLVIGERLGLRGNEIDKLNAVAFKKESEKVVSAALADLEKMTLTVVDGDFPREVLGGQNLTFAQYKMPARRNNSEAYDAKSKQPGGKKQGILRFGHLELPNRDVEGIAATSTGAAKSWLTTGRLTMTALLAVVGLGVVLLRRRHVAAQLMLTTAVVVSASAAVADPCGMVPPVYTGPGTPITRIGEQQTYVFYKDGVESFVIRPGFQGKVEDFGMLIPFPTPPAIRKMPDHIFPHVAAAVDPPEVVIDVRPVLLDALQSNAAPGAAAPQATAALGLRRNEVRVLREEAVGMYEVAVLEAGSPEALKKWMSKNGFKYPDGMDKVCNEYIEDRWCFVAVKTKVADKKAVDPHAGQRRAKAALPTGATFDGHVQAMGFRFKTDKLVVPMRLSAFNEGELRNIVYLMTDGPRKIRSIPEEYVVRQVTGSQLIKNVTEPLPLRIIGGTEKDLQEWHLRGLKERRSPTPKNGAAKNLFAADLRAVDIGELALPHEEQEKQLLVIGERLGLRGNEIDKLNAVAFKKESEKVVDAALADLKKMTLTVVDGDFPREVLGGQNLTFAEYKMPARRNNSETYDAKSKRPGGKKQGILKLGQFGMDDVRAARLAARATNVAWLLASIGLAVAGVVFVRRRRS